MCPSNNNNSNTICTNLFSIPIPLSETKKEKIKKDKKKTTESNEQSKRHQPLLRLNTQTKPLSQHLPKRQLGLFIDQLFQIF